MQSDSTLDNLVAQLRDSPVAFGTANPVNSDLAATLEDTIAHSDTADFDPIGVIVLEQTPPIIADLRDLAQDAAAQTGLDTILVRTPNVAVGVSDSLTRAQVERGERAMVAEPDYAVGIQAFADAATSFSVQWPLVAALVLVLLSAAGTVAWAAARR